MSQQNLNQIVGAIVIHLCVVREVFVVPLCCPFAMIVPCTLCPSYVFQNQPSLRSLIYGDVSNGFPQNVMLGIQDRGLLSHFASTPTTLKMPRALEHPVHHLLQLLDDDWCPWLKLQDSARQRRSFGWCDKARSCSSIGHCCLWVVTEVHRGGPRGFLGNADDMVHFTDLEDHWYLAVIA